MSERDTGSDPSDDGDDQDREDEPIEGSPGDATPGEAASGEASPEDGGAAVSDSGVAGGGDGDDEDAESRLPDDLDDVPPEADEAFEEAEVGTVDEQEVWTQIGDDEPPAPEPGREVVVPKIGYCERCEFFADPPEMGCTRAGTTIVELVDREHVRVVDCPVVEEREALGEDGPGADEGDDGEERRVFIE